MKVLVVFLVSFLLGVTVRAIWIMMFPLEVTAEMAGQPAMNITQLTFQTLMSLLWAGVLVAVGSSVLAASVFLLQHRMARKRLSGSSAPEL